MRLGSLRAARPAEKCRAEGAHETGRRERRRQRQHGAHGRREEAQDRLGKGRPGKHGLEQQPFRHEAVERRQGRDRQRADQPKGRGARHAVNQSAKPVEIAPPRGVQHSTGAEEEQRLEPGMIEAVQQRRGHGDRGGGVQAGGS